MKNDTIIQLLIKEGRLQVDINAGLVFAPKSNTPNKPIGAITAKGYLRTAINYKGRQLSLLLHRIIWEAAYGALPDGYQIDHIDANKKNNKINNLEAVTCAENIARAKNKGIFAANGRKDNIRDNKGKFGKKIAGNSLDGVQHLEFPTHHAALSAVNQ